MEIGAANLVIKRHGANAVIEAARMVERIFPTWGCRDSTIPTKPTLLAASKLI
jgi:hypothetical protein